uniref:Uncharacterized protein LOC114347143 n=1 Tax=Diabrotica virgifera virgifera TaxID=50390 RepID=A0A6P7H7J0_DIAVI
MPNNKGQSRKLLPKYSGPYIVKKVSDHDRYVIEDPQGSMRSQKKYEGVTSIDKMKPFNIDVSSESEEDLDPNETDL